MDAFGPKTVHQAVSSIVRRLQNQYEVATLQHRAAQGSAVILQVWRWGVAVLLVSVSIAAADDFDMVSVEAMVLF